MIHLIFPALLLLVRLAAGWSLVPVGEVQALGNTTDTSPYDLTVLNCTGSLPASGYPPGTYRNNFTSFNDLCVFNNFGCQCTSNTSTPICFPNFGITPSQEVPAVFDCVSNCTCVSPQAYDQSPPYIPVNSYAGIANATQLSNASCENGDPPANVSIKSLRSNFTIQVDLSCYSLGYVAEIWGLVTEDFDPHNMTLCEACPGGYRDPDCVRQPLPLPGPCCKPNEGCFWANDSSSYAEVSPVANHAAAYNSTITHSGTSPNFTLSGPGTRLTTISVAVKPGQTITAGIVDVDEVVGGGAGAGAETKGGVGLSAITTKMEVVGDRTWALEGFKAESTGTVAANVYV
ncbi:MAG: hypothetical protein M1824_001847 [Vezdaea acicularis]|nr:MAG: hypothetical protein M1824_001847 [Vezdaea acicularis]